MTPVTKPGGVELLALAERVEASTGADRLLDYAVMSAVCDEHAQRRHAIANAYTASLDAVLSLCAEKLKPGLLGIEGSWEPLRPEVWPAWTIRWYPSGVQVDGKSWHAIIATAATPALALLAALLRALASQADDATRKGEAFDHG